MKYLLDSSVFIEAAQRGYAIDLCPGFWDWLESRNQKNTVVSLTRVQDELSKQNDQLKSWASARGPEWFLADDAGMAKSLSAVTVWVHNHSFSDGSMYRLHAKNKFFECTDYFLVAFAHGNGLTLVTQEKPCNGPAEVKIPTVCQGLKVPCINMFKMLRDEGFRLRTCGSLNCKSECHRTP